MEGGVRNGTELQPWRLERVLQVIAEQNADVLGLQETSVSKSEENELLSALRVSGNYNHRVVFDIDAASWVNSTGAALFSQIRPARSRYLGNTVKAVEMIFSAHVGECSISNVYLSHRSEAIRLPQIQEVLTEVKHQPYSIIMGDFNALSPEDGIPNSAMKTFSSRMLEKYCRDGKLCYDTIEAILNEGYIDVGLDYHKPEKITGRTDLGGPKIGGGHTQGIRMDFIFAKPDVLPYVKEFVMVKEGIARVASDHFPWYMTLDDAFFQK